MNNFFQKLLITIFDYIYSSYSSSNYCIFKNCYQQFFEKNCSYHNNYIYLISHQRYQVGHAYGVATISRPLQIIGLFCRISSPLQGSFAKETCNFKEPTSRSHPISKIRPVYLTKVTYIRDQQRLWGGYEQQAPQNYRSLLRKSPIKEMIFCKRDL